MTLVRFKFSFENSGAVNQATGAKVEENSNPFGNFSADAVDGKAFSVMKRDDTCADLTGVHWQSCEGIQFRTMYLLIL